MASRAWDTDTGRWKVIRTETLWQRITGGFKDSLRDLGKSLQDLLVGIVVAFPFLLVYGGIGLAIFLVIRKIVKKAPKRQPWKTPEQKESE